MDDFLRWNDALAAHYFNQDAAGASVFLYASEEVIAEIGRPLGGDFPGFLRAVLQGPPWATRSGLCQRAMQGYDNWRARGRPYPPYVAYLVLFVLAAGNKGPFAAQAYYPRLRQLLGLPPGGMLPSFDRMLELWDDLERWSNGDRNGELGLFEARIVGGWIHVGLPLAQMVLTPQERQALPAIFGQAGLDSTSPPSDAELASVLRLFGKQLLRARTLNLLRSPDDDVTFAVLIDVARDELQRWDEQVRIEALPASQGSASSFAALRLCLLVDSVAGTVRTSLRCRVSREFPEAGLHLTDSKDQTELFCDEFMDGWSSPLIDTMTGETIDPATRSWLAGIALREPRLNWRCILPARTVRIFGSGLPMGIPGLVEMNELQQGKPFYLLYRTDCWPRLRDWAQQACRGFTDIATTGTVGDEWRVATIEAALTDTPVKGPYPVLSLSNQVRLRLVDGVRSRPGNTFFSFALPAVVLEGGDGTESLTCNGHRVEPLVATRRYQLSSTASETRLVLEAQRAGQPVKRQSLYVAGAFRWQLLEPETSFDAWGRPDASQASAQGRIAGAYVRGSEIDLTVFTLPTSLPEFLARRGKRPLYLIGRRAGQVRCWPDEPAPTTWQAVWAVSPAKRSRVQFLGGDLSDCLPVAASGGPPRRIRLWKQLLWQRRKRLKDPSDLRLRRLWRAYQEAARRVRGR